MSCAEIAGVMGTSARTAETQVVHATKVLRHRLAAWLS
jgi:hypothetical protein